MCHCNGCWQETTHLHAICYTKTRCSSLTHNRVLYQLLARSLCVRKVKIVAEDTSPFRQKARKQPGRTNLLLMGLAADVGPSSTTIPDARTNPSYSTSRSSTPSSAPTQRMPRAIQNITSLTKSSGGLKSIEDRSTCGEADVQVPMKTIATRRIKYRSEIHSNESRHLPDGTEVARLRWRFLLLYSRRFHSVRSIDSAGRD